MTRRCCIFFLLLWMVSSCPAQQITRYNTFSYSVNEGLLQSTIWGMAIDKNNFCWLSFPNGIQQFDGYSFKSVKIQPGLPDDRYVKFFCCSNGDLLISHSRGISKYEPLTNGFTEIYRQDTSLFAPAIFIGEDDNLIYFYDGAAAIKTMQCGSYKIISTTQTGFTSPGSQIDLYIRFSDNIVDHRVAFWWKNTYYLWDLREKKILYKTPEINNSSPFFLHMASANRILYYNYTDNDALLRYDFPTGVTEKLIITGKDKNTRLARFNLFRWGEKNIISINNHLYETDSTFLVIKSELVNFQNLPVAAHLGIAGIMEDKFGNLYLQTITGGIRKIIRNNYPIKYYGTLNRQDNTIVGILPDKKNNRILAGTYGSGLLVFDTTQQLIRHLSFQSHPSPYSGINAMVKTDNDEYLLFPIGEKTVWRLSADLSKVTQYPISYSDTQQHNINYFTSTIFRDSQEAIVQSTHQFFIARFKDNRIISRYMSEENVLARLWYDNKILWHEKENLVLIDGYSFKEIKKIPFPNTGGVRSMTKDKEGNIFLGSNNGIFKIDINGKILRHWNKENGLPDDCIYAIAVDADNRIWASCNKGIFRIDTLNNIFQLTKDDGLQENEFNTGVVATADDGEFFFGGMNGVSSFFPSAISNYNENINVLVTRIRVNNSDVKSHLAPWNISQLNLSYKQSSLSFDFIAMGNNNPGQYIYQYRMKGFDKDWIQNTGLQTIRYSLAPGKYTFQVFASRSFNKDGIAMKEIHIFIQQPFWRRWWFIGGVVLGFIGIIVYIINTRNRRKYERKLQQLENEKQIKLERERISKDLHDSLGAYANAVLYKTEQLEKEKTEIKKEALIGDLKFASKDIITSLRETVWALKKESYTAEDCLLRIRNFIQPFTRYYEQIHFKIKGDAPQEMKLHYARALNLVRIVQEAVSNSIKHANASSITVLSVPLEQYWKIAIIDNGKGFDYGLAKESEQGNGLTNMRHRAEASGFEFDLQTGALTGTTITLIIE